MNKELIKKYKNEFNHWLNNKSLLMANKNTKSWITLTDNTWNIEENFVNDLLIVINDEYVEFRKALAEGKTVQCNAREGQNDITYTAFGHNWWVDTTEFKYATNFYRIKPDEPKFKVGDFVRYVNAYTPKALEINNINGDRYYFTNAEMSCTEDELITWTPVKGEWCWFYDKKYSKYSHLAQFYDMNISKDNSLSTFMSSHITQWYYCEPFLNSLPSHILRISNELTR